MALTQARVNVALDAALATTTYAQLHAGPPGPSGTANVAAGVDRAEIDFTAASGGTSSGTASFAIPGAGGPFTHVSLWAASTGGTYNGANDDDEPLDPPESFAGAGTLNVTINVNGI